MKKTLKLALLALISALIVGTFTSCNEPDEPTPNVEDLDLVGDITDTKTLKEGNTYKLLGGLTVKEGGLLVIEKGVTIIAADNNAVPYILVEQGGKMDAQGTADKPIVMTAENKEPGAWGGVHICGRAPINVSGTALSEIGDAPYGGNIPNDNSGTLRYIRLEYTGFAFSEEKESNGFTFYGVGNGTTVEYLQSYMGADDGFEWFGGAVNVKYLVATNSGDDSFDWTEGWTGKAQYLVAYQDSNMGDEGDCLIEADNNSKDNFALPISHPKLSNVTLIGNNSPENKKGIRLRAGTQAEIYNTLVKGKADAIVVETVGTGTSLADGISILDHIYVETRLKSDSTFYTQDDFLANPNNKVGETINFNNNYVGVIEGGKDLSADSFFEKAEYKGAVIPSNDWTRGWTK
ncbi:MAG: hypothetical protein ACOX4D_04850 [Bacteroidales bacterium]|jgi:hypothetical protein